MEHTAPPQGQPPRLRRAPKTAGETVLAGWPRRRARCVADLDKDGTPRDGQPLDRPTPWVAAVQADAWDPWRFDEHRAERMRAEDLCQLCGGRRGDAVFILAPERRATGRVEMFGGAVCSLRCALLAAAVCPHYRRQAPVGVYQVPSHARVDALGCDLDNDDEYHLGDARPIRVLDWPAGEPELDPNAKCNPVNPGRPGTPEGDPSRKVGACRW